jgi:hypothetical protein
VAGFLADGALHQLLKVNGPGLEKGKNFFLEMRLHGVVVVGT